MNPPKASAALIAADFAIWQPSTTRWSDNDMYGHLNNAVYYELFDAAINRWLMTETGFDPVGSSARGVVVESGCRFFSSVGFPQPITVGIRVDHVGNSSVRYTLGTFTGSTDAAERAATAVGTWTHVYVDDRGRPVPIPAPIRALLEAHAS